MSEEEKVEPNGTSTTAAAPAAAPEVVKAAASRPGLTRSSTVGSADEKSSSTQSKKSTPSSRNMSAPSPPSNLPKGKAPPQRILAKSRSGTDITTSKSSRNLNATLAASRNPSKSSMSRGSATSTISSRNLSKSAPSKMLKKDPNKGRAQLYSKALSSQGIKYGVTAVTRADMVDQEGADDMAVYWEDEAPEIKNPVWRPIRQVLVWLKCMPATIAEATPMKNWLRALQWLALLSDIAAALVAIITFQGVSYCCGKPMMDVVVPFNWEEAIRIGTYVWLALVFCQIYPVVKKGFPFNLLNPFVGFIITINMFFYDSKYQALWMWCVETFAIICEFIIYLLKKKQKITRNKEVRRVGLLTQKLRVVEEGQDPDKAELELKRTRQKYYQLKKEQEYENKLLFWLFLGCLINFIFSAIILVLIIFISIAQGICVSSDSFPNPFSLDQQGRCPKCANQTGNNCEFCSDTLQQCYFAYNGGGNPFITYEQNGTVVNTTGRW